jgi:predicted membrane-bound spermidine synthase
MNTKSVAKTLIILLAVPFSATMIGLSFLAFALASIQWVLFGYSLLPQNSNAIRQSTIHSQWRGMNVIHYENSIYGNIAVTKRGEQYTFFADGVPSITTPVPDIASIEDFVHFAMLFHEKPESILILNGGAGGMIHEILKYPVKRLDYVELDPLLLKLVCNLSRFLLLNLCLIDGKSHPLLASRIDSFRG